MYYILRFCSGNDRHKASFKCMAVTVGNKRIQFVIRQGGFVYCEVGTYVLRKQQPFVGMIQLIPLTVTT